MAMVDVVHCLISYWLIRTALILVLFCLAALLGYRNP